MISHKHHCVFVHIPKCGGTSIEDIIWPGKRSVSDLWMGNISRFHNKYQTGGLQHLFAIYIRHEVGREKFEDYFKFTFIRNPWDRAISQYHYMRSRPDLREYIGMAHGDSFKRYLGLIQKRVHVQWEPQYKFIYDENGELVVDLMGRFENFQRDVRRILSIIGVAAEKIPHRLKTVHRPYYEYYDAEAIEMVQSIYRNDITAFGYTFRCGGDG